MPSSEGRQLTTVARALRRDGGEVRVRGFVVASGSSVRLCEELLESLPPQCGGDSIEVVGLPETVVRELVGHGDVRWSDGLVTIAGTVSDGRLIAHGG